MKICTTQLESEIGNIELNILKHIKLINIAIKNEVKLIVFPELSITGYDHKSAKRLATTVADKRFNIFQNLSDENDITIAIGVPTLNCLGINISTILFMPNKKRVLYSKILLHDSEKSTFVEGTEYITFNIHNNCFSLAICYESLQDEHIKKSKELGANIYLASVANSQNGVTEANRVYSELSRKYSMTILMSNCLGNGAVGQSSIWNEEGKQVSKLDNKDSLLIFDINNKQINTINHF